MGVAGAEWDASIVPLRANSCTKDPENPEAQCGPGIPPEAFLDAIKYVEGEGIDIFNMSAGWHIIGVNADTSCHRLSFKERSTVDVPTATLVDGLLETIDTYKKMPELVDDGGNVVSKVLYVFSAGNDTLNIGAQDIIKIPGEPLKEVLGKNVLFVGATNDPDENWCQSNFGRPTVEIWAPGVDWYGLVPGPDDDPGATDTKSGTSFAAPAVAGVAALALSSGASGLRGQPAALHDWLIDRRREEGVSVIVERCFDITTTCFTENNQPFIDAAKAVLPP